MLLAYLLAFLYFFVGIRGGGGVVVFVSSSALFFILLPPSISHLTELLFALAMLISFVILWWKAFILGNTNS